MNHWWDDTPIVYQHKSQDSTHRFRYQSGPEGGVVTISRKGLENLLREAGYTIPSTLLVEEQFEPQPYLVG